MRQPSLTIRPAIAADADDIGRLAQQFAAYLRALGDDADFKFDAQTFLRDGFGAQPAFFGIVAEIDGRIIGYLLYHHGYDTDSAMRLLQIIDLYIDDEFRGRGAGRALMEAATDIGRRQGAKRLEWGVYAPNQAAKEFYQRVGARYRRELDFMYLEIDGSSLDG